MGKEGGSCLKYDEYLSSSFHPFNPPSFLFPLKQASVIGIPNSERACVPLSLPYPTLPYHTTLHIRIQGFTFILGSGPECSDAVQNVERRKKRERERKGRFVRKEDPAQLLIRVRQVRNLKSDIGYFVHVCDCQSVNILYTRRVKGNDPCPDI
jgi:hypothetical protein